MLRNKGYDFIRFFATLSIFIWHFYTTLRDYNFLHLNIFDSICINFGSVGVGLFFILSGALLVNNYSQNLNIKKFYKKRLIKIYLPLWIAYIFFYIVTYISNPHIIEHGRIGAFLSFMGLDLFIEPFYNNFFISLLWLVGEWFTTVIIIVYLIFPILRKLYINDKKLSTILLLILFVINLKCNFFTYGNGNFSISNGIMYFWVGMLLNSVIDNIKLEVVWFFVFICISCILLACLKNMSFLWFLPCFFFSISFFIILYNIKLSFSFISYINNISYEIYLLHHRFMILLIPKFLVYQSIIQIFFLFVIIFLIVILFSNFLQSLCKKILKCLYVEL